MSKGRRGNNKIYSFKKFFGPEKLRNDVASKRSLRTTTAAIIAVTLIGLIILLYVFSSVSLNSGFSSLEEDLTKDNVNRAINALNSDIERFDAIANAWATSEGLSGFIASGDTSEARNTFPDGRLVDVGVNILLITDSKGDILWHKYMNLDYNHQMPTPKSLLSQIAAHEDLIGSNEVKGVIMLNSGPMLIASRSLYDSGTGDFLGNLLVGRYLDRDEVSSLSKTTQLSILVIENRSGSEKYFKAFDGVRNSGAGNATPVIIRALDENNIAGFSEISDIYGKPVAVLQVTTPRDVTLYGRGVFDFQIFSLIFAALIFGVVTLVLIQRLIISRLESLNRQIRSVAETENPGSRIDVRGNDEISSLGSAISRMLESIEKGEENYSRLFENANDLIFTINNYGDFTSANRAMENMAGLGRDEILGKNIRDFIRTGDIGKIDGVMSQMKNSAAEKTEVRFISGDANEYIIEFSAQKLAESSDNAGFFVIARDVTAKRKAEEEVKVHRNRLKDLVRERTMQLELANSNLVKEVDGRIKFEESLAAEKERLSVTLSSIAEGVVATDSSGNVTLINKEAAAKTGQSYESVSGKKVEEVIRLEESGKYPGIRKIVDEVISKGKVYEINTGIGLYDTGGNKCPVVLSVAPLLGRHGGFKGAVIVFRDISERLLWEDEALKRQKLESLGVLAGGIAHDFNNILTAVSGNIALAKNFAGKNKDLCLRLDEAEKAVFRAKGITKQLITFSKGGEPVKQVSDIRQLIHESSEFVSHGSNIRLNFDIADDLMNVEADRGQLSQVIENLVINAIQAMQNGGSIYIKAKNAGRISGKDWLGDGEYVLISVKDEGPGIPEEYLKKVFDPYFTTKKNGNGLGLASCMSIIKKHGGAIKISSKAGKGTEFKIYLPATDKKPVSCLPEPDEKLSGSARVLVMDDDKSIYDVIPVLLRGYGFEVEAAKDGAEAVRLYQQSRVLNKPVEVFVMDLTVPGALGGADTIGFLRELEPDILAIVSSGYSNDPVMANFRDHGFDAVLPKPYRIEDLVRLINRLVLEKKENKGK
ncbi:PAS domain S-box-containing protein [Methanomicrobium sp. W14]|uniref:PAS domain S-box protein n=1 Tax=Methanomicrobium sp. W14 TaxID=2817839 RepID=UPI001AE3AFA9|nr:PAS domain S-box protein [Methanomicrobium sp. W14]MBP2132188.1 PAS domain S-box-containing protein [Methanomicrobium sp. W14]